ncbi:hypothetical protein Dda_4729 [Drechslerella dactyloides]|uniref:Rhomboid-type serine protease n=1 Tax=Drechslerella dactyloides TaxID=74499 RepID=A0AAD6IXI0_DREDA|nr:hypothetical protein Dda_4729 [Drechslerella dactyloides]
MAAYDYFNPAGRPPQEHPHPLSVSPPSSISPPPPSSNHPSSTPISSHQKPYRSDAPSPYNPSLEDVRTTYKPSTEPYTPEDNFSYQSAYARNYADNIPLSEHPQHMAGASHRPAYPPHTNTGLSSNNATMRMNTLPHPTPPMREKKLSWWGRRRAKKIPYFCWVISVIQLAVFLAELIRNAQLTGTPIQIKPTFNPMIGPSPYTMINMGARFVPCMKNNLTIGSGVDAIWPCPNATTSTISTDLGNVCSLQELCGFGGFTTPNQWWRLIVPMFMHAGIIHIGFNLLIQLRIGADMEREIGIVRFAVVYLASGIFGFILGANFAGQGLASTGASGALFGILALVLLDLFYTWKQRESPWKDLIFLLIDFAISFVLGLLPGIDNFAHIGGAVMGLALGLVVMRSPPALQSRLGGRNYNSMTASQSQGLRRLVRDPVGFFRGRNPFWWVWWLIRAGMLTLAIVGFILLLRNFYVFNVKCSWCKYISCLPVSNWCDIGRLTPTTTTPNPSRMFR